MPVILPDFFGLAMVGDVCEFEATVGGKKFDITATVTARDGDFLMLNNDIATYVYNHKSKKISVRNKSERGR